MWTPGGQIDRHVLFRGGGKGGGGGGSQKTMWDETTLTDPATGRAYTSSPWSMYQGGKSASEQLNEAITARKAQEATDTQTATDKATADATAKSTADQSSFDTRLSDAYNTSQNQVLNYFRQQGVDPTGYIESNINPALSYARQSVQNLDPNPMAAFSPTLGQSILNDITSGARTRADTAFTAALPSTYAQTNLGYGAVDPYIDEILKGQFDPLNASLTRAKDRGILTDTGYQSALDEMTRNQNSARSQVKTIGQGIIDKDRSAVNDYISGARTNVGNMNASQLANFSIDPYTSGAKDIVDRSVGSLGGDIQSSLGDTKFADLQGLINAGGSAQGSTSGTAVGDALLPPMQETPENDPSKKRGLGSTGAF